MNGHEKNKGKPLLPYCVIEAAAGGDVGAINKVLKHYEGYIIALSSKRVTDDDGNTYMLVDNEIRLRLETNLIVRILQFDVTRAA